MKRIREIIGVTTALAACAGPPAGGQVSPSAEGSLGRLYAYEVPRDQSAQAQEAGFIEVSGMGSVTVEPDRAMVSFAMETRSASANGAATSNADAMDAVLNAIRGGGFAELELETFGYSLRPEYSNNNQQRTREIVGYTALNNVRAMTSDVDAVGRVIDVAIAAGANRVASISFTKSDTEAARSQALALAVAHARAQAAVIAEALGHQLGVPLEVRGGSQRPVPFQAEMMTMDRVSMQAAPTPIEAGDLTVNASVSVKFSLGPELGGR